MMTLADLLRTVSTRNLSKNKLKVARARLRRMGYTNLDKTVQGPYHVVPSFDVSTDKRAAGGTLLASAAVLAL